MTRGIIDIYLSTRGTVNPIFYVHQNQQEFELYWDSKCRYSRAAKDAGKLDIYPGSLNSIHSSSRSTRVSSSLNGQVRRAKSFMLVRTNLNVASINCERRVSTIRTAISFVHSKEQHLRKNKVGVHAEGKRQNEAVRQSSAQEKD